LQNVSHVTLFYYRSTYNEQISSGNLRTSSILTVNLFCKPTPTSFRARTWNTYVVVGFNFSIKISSSNTTINHHHCSPLLSVSVYLANFSGVTVGKAAITTTWVPVAVWLSGSVVGHINEVTLCRAGLMLRWVTVRGYTVLVFNQAPRPTQPGHPSVGRQNEY